MENISLEDIAMGARPLDSKSSNPGTNASVHAFNMQNNPEYAAAFKFQQETANQGLQDTSLDFLPGGGIGEAILGGGVRMTAKAAAKGARKGAKDILPGYGGIKKLRGDAYNNYADRVSRLDEAGLSAEYSKLFSDGKKSWELEGAKRDRYMALENAMDNLSIKKGEYDTYEDWWDYTDTVTGKAYSDGMSSEEFLEMSNPKFAADWAKAGYPAITDEAVDKISKGKATLSNILKSPKNIVNTSQ